jgi:transformation/transcription domain-associated protein
LESVQTQATEFLHRLARGIFAAEFDRLRLSGKGTTVNANSTFSAFLDAWPHGLARDQAEKANKAKDLIMSLIQDLRDVASENKIPLQEQVPLLHQITNRFLILCLDDSWARKTAGCNGIRIMLNVPQVGKIWVKSRDVELVRTLLHIIKDLPPDHPQSIDEFIQVLREVLKTSASNHEGEAASPQSLQRAVGFVGVFLQDLPSSNAVVREVSQSCITLLAEISGKTHAELMMQFRDRMLANIYAKPLRALPFPIQIGMIEAIRYCVSLNPPIVELSEELIRLLHEAVALADADDSAFPGRGNLRQNANDIIKLRVASIKLLTASMPLTDFFSKHPQTRQRFVNPAANQLHSNVN